MLLPLPLLLLAEARTSSGFPGIVTFALTVAIASYPAATAATAPRHACGTIAPALAATPSSTHDEVVTPKCDNVGAAFKSDDAMATGTAEDAALATMYLHHMSMLSRGQEPREKACLTVSGRKLAALKADDTQARTTQHPITPDHSIRTVHIVSQCHLDAGYKYPFVAEVASEWFEKWIPQSIELSEKLRSAGGQVQHRWTMNPWFASFLLSCPMHRAVWEERNEFTGPSARPSFQLKCPNASAIAGFKAAVQRGDINFYASGFCTMYEYADDSLLSWISEFTHSVGTMAGQSFRSTVASQRDEPGITRSAIPLLVDKGVTGYVAGVDWASPVAAVPRAFVWRDEASGKELLMAWHNYGYGGGHSGGTNSPESSGPNVCQSQPPADGSGFSSGKWCNSTITVPGWDHALALFVQDDNEGPPTEAQLHHYWNQTRLMFPNATKIISTTYESFFDELAKVKHLLPVVTKEIGDTWVDTPPSDPLLAAQFRALMRARRRCVAEMPAACNGSDITSAFYNFSRYLIKNVEHDWGPEGAFPGGADGVWSNAELQGNLSSCDGTPMPGTTVNGTVVGKCDASDGTQQWEVPNTTGSPTTVKHIVSGLCLSFQGVSTHSSVDVGLMPCDTATQWRWNSSGLQLAAVATPAQPSLAGMCLDCSGGQQVAPVNLWACHARGGKDLQNQQWQLLPGQVSTLRNNGVGGGCLTVGQVLNTSSANPGCQDVVGWLDQRSWGTTLALEALNQSKAPHPLLALATAELEALTPRRPNHEGLQSVPEEHWSKTLTVCAGSATVAFDGSGAISLLTTHANSLTYADQQHKLAEPVVHVSSQKQRKAWALVYLTDLDAFTQTAFFKTDNPLGDGRGYLPTVTAMWSGEDSVLFRQALPPHVVKDYGGAAELWQRYDFAQPAGAKTPVMVNITTLAFNKTATRTTESWWLRFHPSENAALKHSSMRLDKLGALIDPLDVVFNGSKTLHGVQSGVIYGNSLTAGDAFRVGSLDVPIVKVGAGNASLEPGAPPLESLNPAPVPNDRNPNLADGFGFNVYNNLWATNGIEWYPYVSRDRDWLFRFSMVVP